ncbi:hypothetical protein [Profundibacter sp.]|uniref:hypothetical protein n=1 Tax=Profundibacter sp. TaxID=3101071 RepID=UPI003D0B1574
MHPEITPSSNFHQTRDTTQFNTALSASASVINIDPNIGNSVTVYGIAVEYLFVNNTYFNASYSDGSNGVPRNIDLSVGWRF